MPVSNQLRLLLWKDYLMRKRKPITLAGIFWAIGVVASICIVRFNIDNQDFPTCQFAARALPSAGLLTFLQSFICNMSPLVNNETIIDVAASIPDALKLISTLSAVADEPAFLDLAKNGIHVKDMLRSRNKVQRYLKDQLALPDDVVNDIIEARIGFEGIMKGDFDRCSATSMRKTIIIEDDQKMEILVGKLCKLTKSEIQKIMGDLVTEIDLGKYITMAGNMYTRLSGDNRLAQLGKMTTAALRMMSRQSFLPPELNDIISGDGTEFTYVDFS
ncbi:unnamed protein product, partial [Leptidea sinapis]